MGGAAGAFEGELPVADVQHCDSHAHRRSTRDVEHCADGETEAVRAVEVPYCVVMAARNEHMLEIGLCAGAIANARESEMVALGERDTESRLRRSSVWGYCAPSEAVHRRQRRADGAAAEFLGRRLFSFGPREGGAGTDGLESTTVDAERSAHELATNDCCGRNGHSFDARAVDLEPGAEERDALQSTVAMMTGMTHIRWASTMATRRSGDPTAT